MSLAYVDSSCLVAIIFDEPGASAVAARITSMKRVFSSNLLEAEVRSAVEREGLNWDAGLVEGLSWVMPDRALSQEMAEVLAVGYLRGADLWHVACALFVAARPRDVTFLSLDERQGDVARRLGFAC